MMNQTERSDFNLIVWDKLMGKVDQYPRTTEMESDNDVVHRE